MSRLRLPGWVVIGSTGRNSGKTEFACAIIRACRSPYPPLGIKVTTIRDDESCCPRGGAGCGACSTLDGDFSINEETGAPPGKDTTRMLESGARRVFWLRCRQQRLRDGLEALASLLGPEPLVVAESNSLVQAAEPDLFLMVRDTRSQSIKCSAAEGFALADRVILSDGTGFDPPPQCVGIRGGRWLLIDTPAAILSAGKRLRGGHDQDMLSMERTPLLRQRPTPEASPCEGYVARDAHPEPQRCGGDPAARGTSTPGWVGEAISP
ncbi:MAG: hypothetical protein L0Y78_09390 [candidate division NC10 bacterium]|nr:hypothetical protein [candidate division NC10 bacterium]